MAALGALWGPVSALISEAVLSASGPRTGSTEQSSALASFLPLQESGELRRKKHTWHPASVVSLKLGVGSPSRACVRGSPSSAPAHVALGLPGRVRGLSRLSEGHWLAGCVRALELAFKAKGLFSCEPLLSQEWRAVQHLCS